MKKQLAIAASLVILLGQSVAQASLATISIDGDFSDWDSVPLADSDPADNPGFADIGDIVILKSPMMLISSTSTTHRTGGSRSLLPSHSMLIAIRRQGSIYLASA